MTHLFLPVFSGTASKPVAYIGPSHNLRPVARKHLTRPQKWAILERQRSRCNSYGDRIHIYPYANCDADHIISVCRGGKTLPENMNLLCLPCHRRKTCLEAGGLPRTVNVALEPGDTSVYIFTEGVLAFPVDKRTPLEAIGDGCALSLLSYKRVDRTFVEPAYEEVDYAKMLQRFVYTPPPIVTAGCQS
ncbi:EsV-1-16 [Ectocarpus siliculosus virus 1]|uniref:EsV-1-16 n=1 Tax=Ectocarpus siliculosus virus 1 (isolate New Zealand/Kaikoura/1988) TaxID=654926 RepID=Q8QNP5_ESV1K|nr:EsV-1-16 [Ectocarpus siliculosus virus 1]AAK14442.1 EsV-1-16 [Ectocarpus siliculosus virus 1]